MEALQKAIKVAKILEVIIRSSLTNGDICGGKGIIV